MYLNKMLVDKWEVKLNLTKEEKVQKDWASSLIAKPQLSLPIRKWALMILEGEGLIGLIYSLKFTKIDLYSTNLIS